MLAFNIGVKNNSVKRFKVSEVLINGKQIKNFVSHTQLSEQNSVLSFLMEWSLLNVIHFIIDIFQTTLNNNTKFIIVWIYEIYSQRSYFNYSGKSLKHNYFNDSCRSRRRYLSKTKRKIKIFEMQTIASRQIRKNEIIVHVKKSLKIERSTTNDWKKTFEKTKEKVKTKTT